MDTTLHGTQSTLVGGIVTDKMVVARSVTDKRVGGMLLGAG